MVSKDTLKCICKCSGRGRGGWVAMVARREWDERCGSGLAVVFYAKVSLNCPLTATQLRLGAVVARRREWGER